LDAWILSTYQRLEQLQVPAFAHLSPQRRLDRLTGAVAEPQETWTPRPLSSSIAQADLLLLPTGLPGDPPRPEQLDPARRLSLLMRYLAAPLRYEPGTMNAVHKAVPSSRGLFPLSYFLLLNGAAGAVAYEYIPQHHAFRQVVLAHPLALDRDVPAALACVARIWRVAEIYGEFSHFPCTLEGGHAHGQLNHLAAVLGIQSTREVARAVAQPL